MATRAQRRRTLLVLLISGVTMFLLVALELGLRVYKSLSYDGRIHLSSSSINNVPHPTLGWTSPPSLTFEKDDPCYGSGRVSYNEAGFRAPPLEQATDSHPVICVLGDSTMQGYQLPDGTYFPHQLTKALLQRGETPYVLPLAVGGYGSVQQWMLYEQYCRPLGPDVVIVNWADNDPINNSYTLERYSGPANNNARPRPYLDPATDTTTMRTPYPLSLGATLDDFLLVRVINTVLLGLDMRSPDEPSMREGLEEGYAVARAIAERFADEPGRKIALVSADQHRAREMFRAAGFELAIHRVIPDAMRCLPRDSHPNSQGHAIMVDALLEVMVGPVESPLHELIGNHGDHDH